MTKSLHLIHLYVCSKHFSTGGYSGIIIFCTRIYFFCARRYFSVLYERIVHNNILFNYIYAYKHDTRYIFKKVDREVVLIRGPLTEL